MNRAIVLNAGFAWAPYQVGVLRHLVVERKQRFDLFAGSGYGALNAALTACGQFDALETFWKAGGPRRMRYLNVAHVRQGVLSSTRLRKFIDRYVRPESLLATRAQLIVNLFNVQTGREELLRYPGAELPLADAVLAATTSAGLEPGVSRGSEQLFDGTFVRGFLAEVVATLPVREIYAVAACLPSQPGPPRRYDTWPAILNRALEMNQMHDVRQGMLDARISADTTTSFARVRALMDRVSERIEDEGEATRLRQRMAAIAATSPFLTRTAAGPKLTLFAPSRQLGYPIWQFDKKHLESARRLGWEDARAAMARSAGTHDATPERRVQEERL